MISILIVDDDHSIIELLKATLQDGGYTVIPAYNGAQAIQKFAAEKPDLVLVDYKMPDMTGLMLISELKKSSPHLKSILVTAFGSEEIAIEAVRQGINDYIKKPFDLTELILRVQYVLKTHCYKTQDDFLILPDNYRYNVRTYELTCNSMSISLSKTESEILNLFLMNRNNILTLEMLYDKIWSNDVDPANARVQINNLRRKLPQDLIKNIYGTGYRLDC